MLADGDHYEDYYADKLWNLLPAVYRSEDSAVLDQAGPLRELVERIGAQAAIVRRSIDRMWDDQSIETCDAWLVPYIADLLATNLVSSQDLRGQRLDVAKTIYYRRRKGTVALLEELAADVTGWSVRVSEFFRRLGRTRHNFDPAIGLPSAADEPLAAARLQLAEGLVGAQTHTPLGGWADLRQAYGAQKTQTAFDEFHHMADFRRGRGQVGWHNIPRLGVFLWRLRAFPVFQATPVEYRGCPGQYTFDPTGREIPLFAAGERAYGTNWVSPQEWQLPTAISQALLRLALPDLYGLADPATGALVLRSLDVFDQGGNLVPAAQITADPSVTAAAFFVNPEQGRLIKRNQAPNGPPLVAYHYGFSSTTGAGPYDRRQIGERAAPPPPAAQTVVGGGAALDTALAALSSSDERAIVDSLTYDQVRDVGNIDRLALSALNKQRPLVRIPAATPAWAFTGNPESQLTLTGLFISGGDVILRGDFDTVTLTCCTLDPGTANHGAGTNPYAAAVDGRDLAPARLWIEGRVRQLVIDRCILGPIRTRLQGAISEQVTITDSIIQAVPPDGDTPFDPDTLPDPAELAVRLRDARDPLSVFIKGGLAAADQQRLNSFDIAKPITKILRQNLAKALNDLVAGPALYDPARFAPVHLTPATLALVAANPTGAALAHLNRRLLFEAYPVALSNLALAITSGAADLERCTVLGPAYLHRLTASECILDDVTLVDDTQHGCVRFSAWSTGSVLPRRYESVEIAAGAPLFTSRDFGLPGYAQLLTGVDAAIVSTAPGATIAEGAQNGSEMGAFAREGNPLRESSLTIKFDEFMPLGLTPVLVHVT